MPKIFFSIGEASGDLYASIIIKELIKLNIAPTDIFALGGPMIKETGVSGIHDIEKLQILGFAEGIRSYFTMRKTLAQIKKIMAAIKPDIFVPIAFSGFNLPLIKFAKNIGSKVIYFAPPQIWAWGKFRITALRKYCDKVICLFPFEYKSYQQAGINAYYWGNPLIEYVKSKFSKIEICQLLSLQPEINWLTFMPGSRPSEINRHLPLVIEIIKHLQYDYPQKFEYFILINKDKFSNCNFTNIKNPPNIHWNTNYKYEIMAHSHLIVLCSGTASIEATILNVPFISFYQLSTISYLLAKIYLKTNYFTLTNIIANKKVVQEFAQPKFNTLYDSIKHHLENDSLLKLIRDELKIVEQQLYLPHSSSNIARTIIDNHNHKTP